MRRDGAENRDRILLAAEHVFGSGGATASTEEIARHARVGIATVFRHFPTKQDLIEATVARHLQKLDNETRRLIDAPDPGEAFASLIHTLVWAGSTKMTLLDLVPTDDRGPSELVDAAARSFLDGMRLVLERAQAAGVARPDTTVDDVSMLVRALGYVATPDEREAVDGAVGIVLDGLGVPRLPAHRTPGPERRRRGRAQK